MRIHAIVLLAAATLLSGCGSEGPEESSETTPGQDTLVLAVRDTIGVLYGDTTMEFGAITDAEYRADGSILVLDGMKGRLSVFDPEGSLLRTVGRLGSGPGEFQYPRYIAQLSDGLLAVSDWSAASVVYFDEDLGYLDQLIGFYPTAPQGIVPGPDGSIIGGSMSLAAGETYSGDSYLGLWSGGMEPELIYLSHPLDIEVVQDGDDVDVNVNHAQVVFDTDREGNLYAAVQCDSTWLVTGFAPDGSEILAIEKDWEPVLRTEEELQELIYHESLSRGDAGSSVNRSEVLDPYLYHDAIATVRVGDEGNIWVAQGYSSMPTFEVYDPSGELLHVVVIPELNDVTGLDFCFHNGLLAFDYAPVDYPKVYLLELADR